MDFNSKPVIAMIHVPALPGTPEYTLSVEEIYEHSLEEARNYKDAGLDVILVENMHDIPYMKVHVGPEITAAMAVVSREIKKELGTIEVGIQILAAANKEALAVAKASNLDFVRVEGFVFGHVADEGYIDGCAGEILRYRKNIGAENVKIFTDIKKKHSSHSITEDISTVEMAKAADFFLSDGVIITGTQTGSEPELKDVQDVKKSVKLPVIVGSGITLENIQTFYPCADAFIIGSYFKKDGYWKNKIDSDRVKSFMEVIYKERNKFNG